MSTTPVNIKIKLDEGAIMPTKAHDTDAGWDLYVRKPNDLEVGVVINARCRKLISTGVHVSIPPGYYGKIYERSGLSVNSKLSIKAGVIDSGYTGDIGIIVHNDGYKETTVEFGSKIAQLVIYEIPKASLTQVDTLEELGESDRGDKGFGSSGN